MNSIHLTARCTMILIGLSLTCCTTSDLDPALEQVKPVNGSITTVEDLEAVLRSAYDGMTSFTYYGRDFIINNEVRTDNVFANGSSGRFIVEASFAYSASGNSGVWIPGYRVIASANIVLETDIRQLTGDQDYARHLQGEAYAIRALVHFDILRNYGEQYTGGSLGIPYITEFLGDLKPARATIQENQNMILQDLQTAFDMMDDAYYDSSKEYISRFTAKALESRVAIYFGLWQQAKAAAALVIGSGLYTIIPANKYLISLQIDGNDNSIFELAFSPLDNPGSNSLGNIYKGSSYGDIQVLPNVNSLYSTGDIRANILGYQSGKLRNLKKFPDYNGYNNVAVIRYEEVLLNYAEALFETGGDAVAELNKLTAMRNAPPYSAPVTKDDILNERRKELIFEGFRYDDLLRTGKNIEKVDPQQNITQTIPYGDFRLAFPIPQVEMDANSNMQQNRGY